MNGYSSYILARRAAKKYTDACIAALPKGVVYRGAVSYYADLPSDPAVGDAYTVMYKGTSGNRVSRREYAWGRYQDVLQWIPFGPDDPVEVTIASGDTVALADNTLYTGANIVTLTMTMSEAVSCHFKFTTAAAGTIAITFPVGTLFQNGIAPEFVNSKTYEIDFDGLACNYCSYSGVA
jgi:hypothetical protein